MTYLYNTNGYLRWAANLYRGADPYTRSAGPIGEGGGYPCHPIGENWQFYPGPDGLANDRLSRRFDGPYTAQDVSRYQPGRCRQHNGRHRNLGYELHRRP